MGCLGGLLSDATSLLLEMRSLNFIAGMSWNVSDCYTVTPTLHIIWHLHWNDTIQVTHALPTSTMSCIQVTGGGWSRYVLCIPRKLYTDHLYQEHLKVHQPGGTIIPVIVSLDKTQLTLFRDKTTYLIYLTIGNIPKDVHQKPSHHAQILIGYIPTNKLAGISNKSAHHHAWANLFHACMQNALGPMSSFGETGLMMMSGDGIWHRCHPILAIFIGDYSEKALVTCTFNGRCPKCLVPLGHLGEYHLFLLCMQMAVIDTYLLADRDICPFHLACHKARLKPIIQLFHSLTSLFW